MWAIASFELRQRFKMLSTHVYFLMFFALAMLWIAAAGGVFQGAVISFGDKVFINSPFAVTQTISTLGYLGIVIVAAMMGRAVQQDFEYRIQDFFFTAPIKKHQYLFGRFIGAYITLVYIFTSIGLGAWLATFLPAVEAERVGPHSFLAYLLPYLFNTLPNLLIFGAIFFTLAATSRRMLPVYIGSVLLLVGYLIAMSFAREPEYRNLAAWLDPFGSRAVSKLEEYWTIVEKNSLQVPFTGVYLYNRILWLSVALVIFVVGYWRFKFVSKIDGNRSKKSTLTPEESTRAPIQVKRYQPDFSQPQSGRMLLAMTWLNLRETTKNIYFAVIVLAGILFVFTISFNVGKIFGTATYPVTYNMIEVLSGGFFFFMLIITTFYSGELVWRERESGIAQMHDALPMPSWLYFLPKLFALIALQGMLLLLTIICGVLIQTIKGYYNYELGQYIQAILLMAWPQYMFIAVLAMTLQVLINQKFVAYFVMILYLIATLAGPAIGLEHPMLLFGQVPSYTYSDMNGFGHSIYTTLWYIVFWGGAAIVMTGLSLLFWPRGTNDNWASRKQMARRSLSPAMLLNFAVGGSIFLASGGILYYNINIANEYRSTYERAELNASYERRYKRFESRPQPRISDVRFALDLQPENRSAQLKGRYQLINRSKEDIRDIFITINEDIDIQKMSLSVASKVTVADSKLGFYIHQLEKALAPGASITLDFVLATSPKGILGLGGDSGVIYNGTFLNNITMMPHIGYQQRAELQEERDRKKHNLPPKERKLGRDNALGLANNYISNDADWVSFDAVVSTSPDQIAIAPGYLAKEWLQNGRRYFHYTMDKPILNFYSVLSAKYQVKKDQWQGMPLEIYYHAGHEYALDRMMNGMKQSLEYYTKNFSPYQHKQMRIVEFPRYAFFAQAFPNTIPFSEGIGFIAKVNDKDPKDIDYPFYVTAHEVAHQWWAHQVIGGDTRGTTVLTETLSQYSALMVMKKRYGEGKMRRFLSFELDRYLLGRATENRKELPLAQNEDQAYIHYRKGSLVMYALQDLIGEDKVNQALQEVIKKHAVQGPPYPSSTVLLNELRKVTPADKQYFIDDGFESIVLYENRALSASAKKLANGKYEVTVKVNSGKLLAGETGEEKRMPMKDWIDIGVDDKERNPLLRQKHQLINGEQSFTVVVDKEPAKAGIDPDNKLIDRKPDDNMVRVELK